MTSLHRLWFGDLELSDPVADGDHGFHFHLLGDGSKPWGDANPVLDVIEALRGDGGTVEYRADGMVELTWMVAVHGPDHTSIAEGSRALRGQMKKPNTLRWLPTDGMAPITTWDVLTSYSQRVAPGDLPWDLAELRGSVVYQITFVCHPFPRSDELTVAEPLSVGGSASTATIDTCDATTGWSGTRSGSSTGVTSTFEAGAVGVAELDDSVTSPEIWTLTRTGTIDTSAMSYLVVEARTISNAADMVTAYAGPSTASPKMAVMSVRDLGGYYFEFVYKVEASSVTAVTFLHKSVGGEPWQGLFVRNISQTNMPPGNTPRQVARVIPVGGTERTEGSIHIASRSGGLLHTTFVHTSPVVEGNPGYNPALREAWRVSGNTETTDATMLSGKREPIHPAAVVAEVPNTAIPSGTYVVAAMLSASVAGTVDIYWTIRTLDSGGVDIHGTDERVTSVPFFGGIYELVQLGVVTLPIAQANNALTTIDILRDAASATTVTMDDLYLFRADEDCALTILSSAKSHLWLDSPGVGSSTGGYWTGDESDRSDAHHPGDWLLSPGIHTLTPGLMHVWTATSGAEYPDATIEHYKRWDQMVAED